MKVYLASFKKSSNGWEYRPRSPEIVEDCCSQPRTFKDDRKPSSSERWLRNSRNRGARRWPDEKLVPCRTRSVPDPRRMHCVNCEQRVWVAYPRPTATLIDIPGLVPASPWWCDVAATRNVICTISPIAQKKKEPGRCPHGEFGLDIITVVGQLCYGEHRYYP